MKKFMLFVVAALAGVAGPTLAHHSQAPFDPTRLVILKGAVVSFSYLNPHSWIGVMAAVDGKTFGADPAAVEVPAQ